MSTWIKPVFNIGDHKSANGLIEYRSDALCGVMKGSLLTSYYSKGDGIHVYKLSSDGACTTSLLRSPWALTHLFSSCDLRHIVYVVNLTD